MREPTGDPTVDAALGDIARVDPGTAERAQSAFGSVTWGEGLPAVTALRLATFLWHYLPTRWTGDLAEHLAVAGALAELFSRVDRPRYAAMCASPQTVDVLTAYAQEGIQAGFKAYRSALTATGTEPPDIPGVFAWGAVMGDNETTAFWAVAAALEHAVEEKRVRPGRSGWRRLTQQVAREVLDSPRDDLTGSSWLQWVHTERLEHWIDIRGEIGRRLTAAVANRLIHPVAVPVEAGRCLAPLSWLLEHAAAGAPLTVNQTLSRALVVEGHARFGWEGHTPRGEHDAEEARTLREFAKELELVRRSGRNLVLTPAGRRVHAAGVEELWRVVTEKLVGVFHQDVAANEAALLMLVSGRAFSYHAIDSAVHEILVEQNWRQGDGSPLTVEQVGFLLIDLPQRMELLGLRTGRPGDPIQLNEVGMAAALAALRARALRPRSRFEL